MNSIEKMINELCPEGVKRVKLGEVAEVYDGVHSTPKYVDFGIPFVSVENIKDIYNSKKYITRRDYNQFKIQPQKNDLFMTRIGSIGECAVLDQELELAYYVSLALIRPKTELVKSKFLKYILESETGKRELWRRTLVHAVPIKINKEEIPKIEIPLPPLPIQEEIVRILDKCTDLIKNIDEEIALRQKQYEYYRNQLLGEKLEGVERVKLGEVCEIKGRIGFRGYTRKDLVSEKEGAITLSPSNIINHVLNYDECSYISWKKYDESPEIKVSVGDIIFTKTASVGKTALVKTLPKEATINPQLVLLKQIKCNPSFLYYLLTNNDFQIEVKKITGIGSVPNVPQSSLGQIPIPLPPLPIQEDIVSKLDKFNDVIKNLEEERKLRQQQYEHYREQLLTF